MFNIQVFAYSYQPYLIFYVSPFYRCGQAFTLFLFKHSVSPIFVLEFEDVLFTFSVPVPSIVPLFVLLLNNVTQYLTRAFYCHTQDWFDYSRNTQRHQYSHRNTKTHHSHSAYPHQQQHHNTHYRRTTPPLHQ